MPTNVPTYCDRCGQQATRLIFIGGLGYCQRCHGLYLSAQLAFAECLVAELRLHLYILSLPSLNPQLPYAKGDRP